MTTPRPRAWMLPLAVCVAGLALSYAQPSCATSRDIRLEAGRSLFDANRTQMGDPGPSIVAARRLSIDPRAHVYDADLRVSSAFIYPPLAARLYAPLMWLPEAAARHRLALANRALLVGIALLFAWLVLARGAARWADLGAVFGALAVFYPLHHAIELNQATVLVTMLLGVAFVALERGRAGFAGVAVALAIAVKPQLTLVLPLLVFHARRTVIAAAATCAALLALSIASAGVDNHVAYVTHVLPTLARGYAYYANQSFNGLFNRLASDSSIRVLELPPPSLAVRWLTTVAGVAAYGAAAALVWRVRARGGLTTWIFALAWLVATLVSPIAWQHHYAPALFVFALLYRTFTTEAAPRGLAVATAAAFVLVAAYFEVRDLEGRAARVLASYVFFGALVLAGVLARVVVVKGRGEVSGGVAR